MVTALEKAVSERSLQNSIISRLEIKVITEPLRVLSQVEVDHYLGKLGTLEAEVKDVHRKILGTCSPTDIDGHQDEFSTMLDKLDVLECFLKSIKNSFIPAASTSFDASDSSSSTTSKSEIRLPRLELPIFDGTLTDWMSFHDMFVSAVHQNTKISKAQKLTYLRSVLTGAASKLIKSIPCTDSNYDVAWKLLMERFQNERELFFSILKRFTSQPQIQADSATGLRSLLDVSKECVRSLETLKVPVDKWDGILIFTMAQKLDATSRQFWELSLKDTSIPVFPEFLEFLEQRARALAAGGSCKPTQRQADVHGTKPNYNSKAGPDSLYKRVSHTHHARASQICKMCIGGHAHFQCPKFIGFTIPQRRDAVKINSLCFNCLRDGHGSAQCPSNKSCRSCKGKHHTLIHIDRESQPLSQKDSSQNVDSLHSNDDVLITQSLLATVVIKVQDKFGQQQLCRALLDGGSTTSMITEGCVQRLGLIRRHNTTVIRGISAAPVGNAKGILSISIRPHGSGDDSYTISTLILPKITGKLPAYKCDRNVWPHIQNLEYADPNFDKPAGIDILLGADIFWDLLLDGRKKGPVGAPIAVRSTLGWLIAGNLDSLSSQVLACHTDVDLDQRLKSFWELESVPSTRTLTKEEELCQSHFHATHTRQEDGRFTVQLPYKQPRVQIGSSREMAVRRLKQLEKRLENQPKRREEYVKFMDEYLSLGHMAPIPLNEVQKSNMPTFYIPHHYVLKESSTSTKLRVVFDASSKSTSGMSLNDGLMVGPTIQDPLINTLIRFRTHPVAFTADITKMYRQISINPTDTDMQRIVWRRDPTQLIEEYRLLTVTYGTASAPYHAIRTLQQLATYEQESFNIAAFITLNDFYVDDVMSGEEDECSAIRAQQQLIKLLHKGGFDLRKFSSNSQAFLEALPAELRETQVPLSIDTDKSVKTLGLFWTPGTDNFIFKVNLPYISDGSIVTKRKLLSDIAKVFDPLGWLAPSIIRAKILFQQLWKLNIGWDDPLPSDIVQEWTTYKSNLSSIENLKIPRCIKLAGTTTMNLHGFCDASEKAYAAVVYLRTEQHLVPTRVSLVTSKTRVAPTKIISLPRLELCGAVLLAQLMSNVQQSLKLNINSIHAWTDSTVVLSWISSHPSRWKTFVANRVTEIQGQLPSDVWGHVIGIENPADCASRGIDPSKLESHHLWWNGPKWLIDDNKPYPFPPPEDEPNLVFAEERKSIVVAQSTVISDDSLLYRYSTLRMLISVTSWLLRFVRNTRNKNSQHGPLTPEELETALMLWIRKVQNQEFGNEIKLLTNNKLIHVKSRLLPLNPFLDPSGVLRVGGRIRHSQLPADQKHPILLPRHSKLTKLIIYQEHLKNFHAGAQLVLNTLQRRFWIIGARDAIRHQIKKCIICTRYCSIPTQQLMGDLPASRVTPARAFSRTGVDYAGPFILRAVPARSKVTFKAYLSLFICLTTHALHLEVVSALSTDAFIAALKRFVARRGRCTDLYSDCGTNFVGAARQLKELFALTNSNAHNNKVTNHLSSDGIKWHFNPPSAPHFGGLWEAGVKSVKFHLNRVLGSARLTFEELTTTIVQIEACLNSRPLTPISSDPNDLTALTPGHFLIGSPLTAIPEPERLDTNPGRLDRWQRLQQLHQQFWNRWSREYLTRLQQRPKWLKHQSEIKVNDMVLIKDERLPPLKWNLGRVISTHPGPDGTTRVVTVRTADGNFKRPIVKLCLLPIEFTSSVHKNNDSVSNEK